MYAEVILSRRFPKSMGVFDYKVPESLLGRIRVGHLVSIPFRKSVAEGVVVRLKENPFPGVSIKTLTGITDDPPLLTDQQLQFAQWMSDYYAVSIGTVIKSMIPGIPKRTRVRAIMEWPKITPTTPTNITRSEQPVLVWIESVGLRQDWYATFFSTLKKQTLVVLPEVAKVHFFLALVPPDLRKHTVVVHSKLGIAEFYDAWKKIRNGSARLIVGTKMSVFLPFSSLDSILVDDEHDEDHKQYDQNPRFDVRTSVLTLKKLFSCGLWFVSPAPTVERYFQAAAGHMTLQKETSKVRPAISIVDMKEERVKKNFSLISDALHDTLQASLSKKSRVFLFLNRRGEASTVVCKECGHTVFCPDCKRPLAIHTQKRQTELVCHACNARHELIRCGHCSSVSFKYIGGGTQRLEREVINAFPGTAVSRLDADTTLYNATAEIVIGTELARKRIVLTEFLCIGVIAADIMFQRPDFRSSEKAFQSLTELLTESSHSASIIIQSYSPHHPAITHLLSNDLEAFYRNELTERKEHLYPPYSQIVKLMNTHYNDPEASIRLIQKFKADKLSAYELPHQGGQHNRPTVILKLPLEKINQG